MNDVSTMSQAERVTTAALQDHIAKATNALLATQQPDGHFVFELEADATIPAEYVLFVHYLGETPDRELERKIGAYLRRIQGAHGGWPLFHDGAFDMSASVKAYFALKMIGDDINADHMRRAREAILSRGGAINSNVFTRVLLSLYGVLSWRSVPVMPVEIMLLPEWFPFHLLKISYWARTVIVPLLVLQALKPRARNPNGVTIDELFVEADPRRIGPPHKAPHQKWRWFLFFRAIDAMLRAAEPFFPRRPRQRAIDAAVRFVTERLNGEDGLGAIYPAMANSVMMYDVLGYAKDHPDRAIARKSIDKLLVIKDDEAYCQPCVSPVWDTALTCHALLESGDENAVAEAERGLQWLKPLQVLDIKGDWAARRPDVRPGGWAFQYANAYYPDLDDTAVVVMAMDRAQRADTGRYREAIERAREWIEGLQSRDGGWGAFDADNDYEYLNNIPFADHGALLDPPSPDLTGRCLSMLGQLGETVKSSAAVARGVDYLRRTQEADGSWYGRWGMNYIYGTWSAVCGLNAVGVAHDAPEMRKAAEWLVAIQNADGGWGEDGTSYKLDYRGHEPAPSTASQTAWALLALMAAGRVDDPAVERGIGYLTRTQGAEGLWNEDRYTATGFPRVFYLRYHGYSKFFPLWAMARYRNLKAGNSRTVAFGV
jgi:squalene-hopene/tetraprenyl-beta-curcumene cyclase